MTAPNLFRLPPAAKAYIRDLEARASADAQGIAERDAQIAELIRRVEMLEEQYRLALAQRFAPKSEKRKDRVFDEAEQIAETEPADEDDDLPVLPETGLPDVDPPESGKRGRKPLPANLPRERVEYDLPEDQKACPCCSKPLHRIGERTVARRGQGDGAAKRSLQVCLSALREPRRTDPDHPRADANTAAAG